MSFPETFNDYKLRDYLTLLLIVHAANYALVYLGKDDKMEWWQKILAYLAFYVVTGTLLSIRRYMRERRYDVEFNAGEVATGAFYWVYITFTSADDLL